MSSTFEKELIKIVKGMINELSGSKYPLVTENELYKFFDDYSDDIEDDENNIRSEYGDNRTNEILYFLSKSIYLRYCEDVLKYVNYERRNLLDESNNTTIEKGINYGKD